MPATRTCDPEICFFEAQQPKVSGLWCCDKNNFYIIYIYIIQWTRYFISGGNVAHIPRADNVAGVQLDHFLKANGEDVYWVGFAVCRMGK